MKSKINVVLSSLLQNAFNLLFLLAFIVGINSQPQPTPLVLFIALFLIIRLLFNIIKSIELDLFNAKQEKVNKIG